MAELKDANTNPWYVLMTLYGEQTGERVDRDLAERNRQAWNGWWALRNQSENIEDLARGAGVNVGDFRPSSAVLTFLSDEAEHVIRQRCGVGVKVPLFSGRGGRGISDQLLRWID